MYQQPLHGRLLDGVDGDRLDRIFVADGFLADGRLHIGHDGYLGSLTRTLPARCCVARALLLLEQVLGEAPMGGLGGLGGYGERGIVL